MRTLLWLWLLCLCPGLLWADMPPAHPSFDWTTLSLPDDPGLGRQPGLSGHFAGHTDGLLLIGGGTNFPGEGPAYGGRKHFYSTVYPLRPDGHGGYEWLPAQDLGYAVGHAACFSTPKGLVVAGGLDTLGGLRKVVRLRMPEGSALQVESLPDLPVAVSDAAFGRLGSSLVIAAGLQDGKPSAATWVLDLSRQGQPDFGWRKGADMPGPARQMPASGVQNAGDAHRLYLFGGFRPEGAQVFADAWSYDLQQDAWRQEADICLPDGAPLGMNAASVLPWGANHLLCIGGANREIFGAALNREQMLRRALQAGNTQLADSLKAAAKDYLLQPEQAFHFHGRIMAYHTVTRRWIALEDYPFAPPAVGVALAWQDRLWMIGGERKPGVRNPMLYVGHYAPPVDFGWLNYAVLSVYLLLMLGVGFYFMRRTRTAEEFFKAGGRIPWWAAGISIFATSLSAITFMAIPAKTYTTDWRYLPMTVSILMVAPLVIRWYLPFFRRLQVTSAYEYLELRFNLGVRLLSSALFIVFMVARIAIVLYLPSLALSTVTGMDIDLCILLMSLITIVYCTMGGVEAVIWGDVLQGGILVGGALLSLAYLVLASGGPAEMVRLAGDADKFHAFDFALDWQRPTFWVVFLGAGLANSLISYTSDQTLIQRYMTTASEGQARKGIWLNGLLSLPVLLVFYLIGTGLYTFYGLHPERLEVGLHNADGIFPYFMVQELPAGIAGLLIAAVFAATMSTISSNINSVSTALATDFFGRLGRGLSDRTLLRIGQAGGVFAGLAGALIALALVRMDIKSFFDEFNTIIGLLTSGLGGLFAMGIFMPRVHGRGALVGLLGSTALLLYLRELGTVNFMLYGLVGLASCMLLGWVASLLLPAPRRPLAGLTWKHRHLQTKKEAAFQDR